MPKGIYKREIGEKSNHWKGGKPKCIECGKKISGYGLLKKDQRTGKYRKKSKLCRNCFMKKQKLHPNNKGKKFPENSGKNHHNWKGGISKLEGYLSFKNSKRRIRERNAEGSHTIIDWENLKKKYNYMCLCCKKFEPEIKLTEDHIIPLLLGGSDDIKNIQPLCRSCNSIKFTKIINFKDLIKC